MKRWLPFAVAMTVGAAAGVLAFLFLVGVRDGTRQEQPEEAIETVNVVKEASLEGADMLRILKGTATGLEEVGILHNERLQQLLGYLNEPLALQARTECANEFVLEFRIGERVEDLHYRCSSELKLDGNQHFWRDKQAIVPSAFNELIEQAIADR